MTREPGKFSNRIIYYEFKKYFFFLDEWASQKKNTRYSFVIEIIPFDLPRSLDNLPKLPDDVTHTSTNNYWHLRVYWCCIRWLRLVHKRQNTYRYDCTQHIVPSFHGVSVYVSIKNILVVLRFGRFIVPCFLLNIYI